MDDNIISVTNLEVAKDEVLSIKYTRKYQSKPNFFMGGDGTMNKSFTSRKSIDLIQEICSMSSNEKLCFLAIRNGIKWDKWDNRLIYQVPVNMSQFTASQRVKFLEGYKRLNEKDLVRRISKGIYMINPTALIPAEFEREYSIWTDAKPIQGGINETVSN